MSEQGNISSASKKRLEYNRLIDAIPESVRASYSGGCCTGWGPGNPFFDAYKQVFGVSYGVEHCWKLPDYTPY